MARELSKISVVGEDQFPHLLKTIDNPPKQLYFLGELPDDSIPKIAIVGTRKATGAGRDLAQKIATALSEAGIVVVSGLAMGIDTASHVGALLGGSPTVAVLGNGLNSIYPRQNENLAKRIISSGGAIISEYEPGAPAMPHQFLERNRIVSGLSLATIIIEAPIDSGALVTARLAAEQGREVFVFPGPSEHPNFRGSHALIRDGARLVASTSDILEDLGLENVSAEGRVPGKQKSSHGENFTDDKNQSLILKAIEGAGLPLNVDKIIELTNLEPQVVNQSLTLLVLHNHIRETERGYTL